jgi:putative transcriptional regulator
MQYHWIRRAFWVVAISFATALPAVAERPAVGLQVARTPTLNYSDANSPRRGRFLVASRQAIGPFFYQTVVVLLSYDPEGAIGLVINRPTQLPVSALLPNVAEVQERTDPAHFGGPVEPNRVMVLIESDTPPTESLRIIENVFASRSLQSLEAMAKTNGPMLRFRAYVGYAGWGPGQLDGEIARGDWHVDSGDPKVIFDMPSEEIWPKFIRRNTGVQALR